jgi:pSer/pThr/pTyr-binding forkhead associated (FHA) protein
MLQDSSEMSAPPPAPEPAAAGSAPQQAAASGAPARRLIAVLAAPDLGSGTVFAVRGGKNTIGADRSSDVVLAGDSEVSREHAVILHRNGTFHLADRLSTNGTWVNGQEVPANGTVPLNDRDRIRCGHTEMVFLVVESPESSSTGLEYE